MRHLIIKRRNPSIFFLLILLISVSILAMPNFYKRIFVPNEDLSKEETLNEFLNSLYGNSKNPPKHIYYEASSLAKADNSLCFYRFPDIERYLSMDLSFLNRGGLVSRLKIQDLDIKGAKLSGDVVIKAKALKGAEKNWVRFTGKLVSNNMAVDSKPLPYLRMYFKVTKDELKIYSLEFGPSYNFKGRVGLKKPFNTELFFKINRANIRDIAVIAQARNPDVVCGIMNGAFTIKGPLDSIISEGSVESRYGKIGPICYDFANIRFEGFGPIINIIYSQVKESSNRFSMEGYIDLRNIIKGNLFAGLTVKTDMQKVVWDGWDITKGGVGELSIAKDVSDGVRVGFKTMARESLPTYNEKDNTEEMSLEYRLGGKKSFKMRLKEDEGFFGIEHKTKF